MTERRIRSPAIGLRRRPPLSSALGWLTFALMVTPLAIMMLGGGIFGMDKPEWWKQFTSGAFGSALLTGLLALGIRAREMALPGSVTFGPEGLRVEAGRRSLVVPRSEIASGVVVSAGDTPLVALELSGRRTLTVSTAAAAEADAALAAVRLSPPERRFETRFKPGPARAVLGVLNGVAVFYAAVFFKDRIGAGDPTTLGGIGWLLFALLSTSAWLFATGTPEVAVGADGVRIRRALGSRFVPYDRITGVSTKNDELVLSLEGGGDERIRVAAQNAAEVAALRRRIDLALAAHAAEPGAAARVALLDRRGRTVEAWRDDVAELAVRDAGYRAQPLSKADLDVILEAPSTTPEHRIAAALALRSLGGTEAAPRIRIAADKCASVPLRVALERVADEEEVEQAVLEALVAEA